MELLVNCLLLRYCVKKMRKGKGLTKGRRSKRRSRTDVDFLVTPTFKRGVRWSRGESGVWRNGIKKRNKEN